MPLLPPRPVTPPGEGPLSRVDRDYGLELVRARLYDGFGGDGIVPMAASPFGSAGRRAFAHEVGLDVQREAMREDDGSPRAHPHYFRSLLSEEDVAAARAAQPAQTLANVAS